MLIPWILLVCGCMRSVAALKNMQIDFEWKHIEYDYPSEEAREKVMSSDQYNRSNIYAVDVDMDRVRDRTFVTLMGFRSNRLLPATLGTVSNKTSKAGPLFQPYPSWEWYDESRDCDNKIVHVFRVMIDRCNKLWLVDSGTRLNPVNRICRPKLMQFDLNSDTLVKSIPLPNKVIHDPLTGKGFMVGPVVSVFGKHCDRGAAYIPDTYGHALVVYEGFSEKWDFNRLNLSPFHTNKSNPGIYVENMRITNYTKGIYSAAIAAGQLFFNSFTSLDLHESKEANIWFAHNSDHPVHFKSYFNLLSSPATIMASSEKHEALLFASTSESAVHIWNYRHKNEPEIVEQDPSVIKYISGMKVIERMGRKPELIFLSSNYQNVETETMNLERVNFRIIRGDMDKLMEGTKAGALLACNKRSGQGEVTEVHISEDAKKLYHPPEL